MATAQEVYTRMTTPELLQALKEETQRLTRSEAESARRELKETGKKAAVGTGLVATGGVLAVIGCIWLVGAAVWALALALPLWAAALIIGGAVALIGAGIAWAGAERMKRLKPERTIKHLEEDQRWLKGTWQQALATRQRSASA